MGKNSKALKKSITKFLFEFEKQNFRQGEEDFTLDKFEENLKSVQNEKVEPMKKKKR